MKRIVGHNSLPKEKLWVCHFLLLNPQSTKLRCGVGGHIAANHKEATHQHVLLREQLESCEVARAESSKVGNNDGEDQRKAAAVDALGSVWRRIGMLGMLQNLSTSFTRLGQQQQLSKSYLATFQYLPIVGTVSQAGSQVVASSPASHPVKTI